MAGFSVQGKALGVGVNEVVQKKREERKKKGKDEKTKSGGSVERQSPIFWCQFWALIRKSTLRIVVFHLGESTI